MDNPNDQVVKDLEHIRVLLAKYDAETALRPTAPERTSMLEKIEKLEMQAKCEHDIVDSGAFMISIEECRKCGFQWYYDFPNAI